MRPRIFLVLLVALGIGGGARADEVPLERIQEAIARGVERILAVQQPNGSFALSESHVADYPVGQTGLALMALQYARPHLKGDLRTRTFDAIHKGMSFITQSPPEQRTYSAGFILCALFMDNPERHQKLIAFYATMLCISQHDKGERVGQWGYQLKLPAGDQGGPRGTVDSWGDRSNTQIALLGLYYANRAGFQVPKEVWERSGKQYLDSQFLDGGWGYKPELRPDPYANMTIASTISLNLCREMLLKEGIQCRPPPRVKAIENGLKWIGDNWEKSGIGTDTYGLYALERLGIIMGRANIGGHDWYNEGVSIYLNARALSMFGTREVSECFGVMFLARGLEPIIINKLERRDTEDWNNTPYDVKHLVEFIQDHYQLRVQWRIVSLEAPMELLLRTPILHISGHLKLDFNETEKAKLKEYVMRGGTIVAQACCSRRPFDESFREFVKETFGGELKEMPKTHALYQRMSIRGMAPKPKVEVFSLEGQLGRPGIIYLPYGVARSWHLSGTRAQEAYAVGTGIYFYVTIEGRRLYEQAHPEPVKPTPATQPPEPVRPKGPADEER